MRSDSSSHTAALNVIGLARAPAGSIAAWRAASSCSNIQVVREGLGSGATAYRASAAAAIAGRQVAQLGVPPIFAGRVSALHLPHASSPGSAASAHAQPKGRLIFLASSRAEWRDREGAVAGRFAGGFGSAGGSAGTSGSQTMLSMSSDPVRSEPVSVWEHTDLILFPKLKVDGHNEAS